MPAAKKSKAKTRKTTAKKNTSRRSATRAEPDAITLLEQDHDAVKKLLSEFAETTSRGTKKRLELLERIAMELRVHMAIEEEIFYPAYRQAARTEEDGKLFFEANEEHALVDVVLPQLEAADPASEPFGAKAKVLKELVEHHADEEEETMFPKARKLLGKQRIAELGAAMADRKRALIEQGGPSDRKRSPRERAAASSTRPSSSSGSARPRASAP